MVVDMGYSYFEENGLLAKSLLDFLRDSCPMIEEELISAVDSGNAAVLEQELITVLGYLEEGFNRDGIKHAETFRSAKLSGGDGDDDLAYRAFLYVVANGIFEALSRCYIGGKTYKGFVADLLKGSGATEEQVEMMVDRFKKHLSGSKGDFYRDIVLYRRAHHDGAIKPYEEARYAFDFYFRNINKAKKLGDDLWDWFERTKKDKLHIPDLDKWIKWNAEINRLPLERMEVQHYGGLREINRFRASYVEENAEERFIEFEKWMIRDRAGYKAQYYDMNRFGISARSIDIIGRAIYTVIQWIRPNDDIKDDITCQVLLGIANDAIRQSDGQDIETEVDLVRVLREKKEGPVFSAKDFCEDIGRRFTKELVDRDEGLMDFIKLCLYSYTYDFYYFGDHEIEILERSMRRIFLFLRECAKKVEQKRAKSPDKKKPIDIKAEVEELKKDLSDHGISLFLDRLQFSYKFEKSSNPFSDLIEMRYIKLMEQIEAVCLEGSYEKQYMETSVRYENGEPIEECSRLHTFGKQVISKRAHETKDTTQMTPPETLPPETSSSQTSSSQTYHILGFPLGYRVVRRYVDLIFMDLEKGFSVSKNPFEQLNRKILDRALESQCLSYAVIDDIWIELKKTFRLNVRDILNKYGVGKYLGVDR